MLTRENCIKYAEDFVTRLKSKGIDIKIAKIFGSYAQSRANEFSDIDLLLVSDIFKGVGFIDNALMADELIDYDLIQVKTYTLKDYEDGDPFLDEINKSSIVIN